MKKSFLLGGLCLAILLSVLVLSASGEDSWDPSMVPSGQTCVLDPTTEVNCSTHCGKVAGTGSKEGLLDPTTGEIGGKRALAIYALRYEGTNAVEVLDPPGCEVRMVSLPPEEDDDTESVHPCGTWFLEKPGRYLYWIETDDWQMSPFSGKVIYSAGAFEGRGFFSGAPVGPAAEWCCPGMWEAIPGISSGCSMRGHIKSKACSGGRSLGEYRRIRLAKA